MKRSVIMADPMAEASDPKRFRAGFGMGIGLGGGATIDADGSLKCFNCGGPHDGKTCPIKAKICHKCGGMGHVRAQCPGSISSAGIPQMVASPAGVPPGTSTFVATAPGGQSYMMMVPASSSSSSAAPGVTYGGTMGSISSVVAAMTWCPRCQLPGHGPDTCPAATVCVNCGGPHPVQHCTHPSKICHRCGQEGHISKNCPNPEADGPHKIAQAYGQAATASARSIAQPPMGTLRAVAQQLVSSGPAPTTTTMSSGPAPAVGVCLNCGSADHSVKQCPIQSKVCHHCGGEGHISKACPNKTLMPPARPDLIATGMMLHNLHTASPSPQPVTPAVPSLASRVLASSTAASPSVNMCLNCGSSGHDVKHCPIQNKVCHHCGGEGHVSKDCPSKGKIPPARPDLIVAGVMVRNIQQQQQQQQVSLAGVDPGAAPVTGTVCLNCGGMDHDVKHCPVTNKVCHVCGGEGHIARQCPSKGKIAPAHPELIATGMAVRKTFQA